MNKTCLENLASAKDVPDDIRGGGSQAGTPST